MTEEDMTTEELAAHRHAQMRLLAAHLRDTAKRARQLADVIDGSAAVVEGQLKAAVDA